MMTLRHGTAATLVTLLALVATACSSQGGQASGVATPSATTPGTGTSSAGADTPILIGVAIAQSGQYEAVAKGNMQGYILAGKHINESGGLLGRQVEFIFYDDRSEPQQGTRLYERLIVEDEVDLVLGPFSSSIMSAAASVFERHGFPVIAAGASAEDIWTHGYEYIFGFNASGTQQNQTLFDFLEAQGVETIGVINESSPFGQDTGNSAVQLADEYGMEVLLHEEFPPAPVDLSGLLLQAKDANPDALIAGTYYNESVLLARQVDDLDIAIPWIAPTIGPDRQDFIDSLGEAAEGFLGIVQFAPSLEIPGAQEFVEAYMDEFGEEPTYQAALSYSSVQVLQEAVEAVGSLDREALRDQLAEMETTHISGTYEVDENLAQVGKEVFVVQVQNGQREVVWPPDFATADPITRGGE